MGNTSLEQNIRLKNFLRAKYKAELFLYLLLGWSMANVWLLLRKQSHSCDDHCIWAINFCSKVTRRGWVSTPNWVPSGPDYNDITHLPTHPKLHKILPSDLNSIFPKCGNAHNTQNCYSLTLWWYLDLHNTSLDAKFSVQNFSFCWSIISFS